MKLSPLLSRSFRFSGVLLALALLAAPAGALREERGARGQNKAAGARPPDAARAVTPEQRRLRDLAAKTGCRVEWDEELGVPHSVRGADLGQRAAFSRGKGLAVSGRGLYERDAVAVLDGLAGLYRIADAERDFRLKRVQADRLGFHHVRLQQMMGGLRVEGGEVIVHFDKDNRAYEVNGRTLPALDIALAPALGALEALAAARADLSAKGLPADRGAADPELVVYARRGAARLAYAATLTYRDKRAGPGRWRYWVDAGTGKILDCFNDIQTIPAPTGNGVHADLAGSVLAGEGGGATNVTGWYDNVNTNYYLSNTNFHWIVENVAASGYPDANTYAFRPTANWGTSDRTEVSLGRGFDLTQRYYSEVHELESFNGLGIVARANAHEGDSYVNAYWDGSEFYFGDGDGMTADSLAVLDIAGHEFTHAVTEYSANLVYQNEPGALNESFSDILGTCVEFFGQADDRSSYPGKHAGMADWLCGEDSWLASTALRDLRDPANAVTVGSGNEQPTRYLGAYWYAGSGDNGGVHQNSGVQNFCFYLLSEGGSGNNDGISYSVTGIGITNAELVAYRALTVYCTPDTGYRAVRSAWLSAAADVNPAWADSVSAAWDAVGVQAVSISPEGGASFSGSEGGPFSPATFVFALRNEDATAADWGVSHTQSWASVSPEGGSVPAFGSQNVTVTLNGEADSLAGGTYVDTLVFTNSLSAASSTRPVTLLVLPPVVHEFVLDTDPGWTAEGAWAYGAPQGAGGDPSASVTGTNVYGYNLAGQYPDDMPVHALTTLPLDCSRYENLQLSFWRWLGVESAIFDHATIQISTNGTNWTIVWDHSGSSIQDTSWQNFIYRLGSADGQDTVYLRWLMGPTDSSVTYSGWNIDDIRIHGTARDPMRVAPGDSLTSQGYEGGPFSPLNKTYRIVNAESNAFDWTASTTSTWFSVSSPGGTLAGGATATVSVAIEPAANEFAPDLYQGTVLFSNVTSEFTTSRAVALTVLAIPGEIEVTDSILPVSNLDMPFGDVIVGRSRTESITITNSDAVYPIVISRISFGFYLEDFSDGLAQEWAENVDADWNVAADEYRAQSANDAWMISTYGGKAWDDLTAQMACRRTGAAGNSAALLLRATADFDDAVGSAYVFQISVNGSYGVWKQVNGSWSWLQSWTASPSIQPGVNVLRATAQGSALSFYINGALVWSGSDASLADGRVGLGGYTASDTTHFFDDVMAGETLPSTAAVSDAQAALNARPAGGDPRVAPAGSRTAPQATAPVGTQMIVSGSYRMTNEPAAFPCSLPPHSSITFDVIYTPAAVATNTGEVVIENNDADEPEVRVALSGRGIPDYLHISPSEGFSSRGHPGGPFAPADAVYSLANSSALPVTWTAATAQAWATVAPVGGTLDAGKTQSVTVSINASALSLGEGVYEDTVVFSNLTTGIGQVRPVTLTVFTSPQVGVTPAEMWVTNKMGQSQTNVLTVSNGASADGALTFRLASRSTGVTPLPFDGGAAASRIKPGHDFTKAAPGAAFVPGELLVRFAAGVNGPVRAALLASLGGGEVRKEYRLVPGLALVKLPPAVKVEEALAAFNGAAGVLYAEPNYTVRALDTIPDDTRFGELWGLHNTGQTGGTPGADIDAPAAWDTRTGSADIIVCVIDTGIDYSHEDLSGNMWHNPDEIPGNLIDDDSNGYVDDVYGINAINGSGDPRDDHDHGTHCAGTIGGVGNNGIGVAGVNWRVSLMAAKFLNSGGSGDVADAVTCVEYAAGKGARVLSNSWGGGGYSQAMKDAIDAAGAAGIAFVAAAGNANSNNDVVPSYPCGYESSNVVAVMATDHDDLKSGFSSYGQTTVDIAAPGTDILSCKRGGGYVVFSGTSMATPHVAGAAALMLSVNPAATVEEIKQAMMSTADVLFPTLCASGGRINLSRALNEMNLQWLSFDPSAAANLPAGSSADSQVGFHAGELAPAVYNGEIVVTCNDADNPTVLVPVHMTILRDDLRITPALEFAFSGVIGGPFSPTSTVYAVSNAGPSSVTWSLAWTGAWVSVSSAGGTLAPDEMSAVTVTVSEASAALAVGEYRETLAFSNVLSGAIQKRRGALLVQPMSPVVLHSFPLDEDPGWTTEGQWAFGVPQGWDGDPSSGFTGPNVYGYNLAGAYADDIPVYALTTPALDCSGYEDVSLSFRRWLGVEDEWFDHATVEVSADGANWTTVWDHNGSSFQDTSWMDVSYDISAVADDEATVYVRWLMGPTDESVTYGGWNIDDIQLLGRSGDPMMVSPLSGLSSAGYRGGPFSPSDKVYTLTNTGSTNLAWTAACASNWVSVAPGSGTLAAGATTDVTVAVNAGADAFAEGSYIAAVTFRNEDSGVQRTRAVILTVQGEIAFESATCTVDEAGGPAVITVRRGGNTNQAVTVDFATSNGTATAGSDYAATHGTLTFAEGQVAASFAVSILDNALAEGDETVILWLGNPTGGGTLGEPHDATLTIEDDDAASVALPVNLYDGDSYLWDIRQDGNIANGTSDAYDGGHVLSGFPSFASGALLSGGREVVIGPATNAGVVTTRRIYVPADQAYARFVEVLRNAGASTATNRVRLDTNLGSDSSTVIVGTSDGNAAFETGDNWIVTDDTDGSGDPTILHVIANDHGRQRPSVVSYSTGSLGYEYQVVLLPGETKSVMHFGAQNPDRNTATNKGPVLTELGLGALAGLSAEELAQIVNFGLPDARTSLGTPIAWLQSYGLTNSDWETEDIGDLDGDGMQAWQEYVADTDPTIRESVLSVIGVGLDGNQVRLDWKGGRWATQYIEVSGSLMPTGVDWQCIRTNGVLPTVVTNFVIWNGVTNPTLFYRIKAER